MELKRFRVRNYKSIVDSGDCYPSLGVTILAGKNEAGKSSLLEALEDFNSGVEIREKAIPIGESDLKPHIEVEFQIERDEAIRIIETTDLSSEVKNTVLAAVEVNNKLIVEKRYPSSYTVLFPPLSLIPPSEPDNWAKLFAAAGAALAVFQTNDATAKAKLPKLTINPLEGVKAKTAIADYLQNAQSALSLLDETQRGEILGKFAELSTAIDNNESLKKSALSRVLRKFREATPHFVLFSSFDDVFPSQVPFSELSTNKWIDDLKLMSDLDVETIIGSNRNAKKQHKHQLNLQLNSDFSQFWTQDVSELSVDWDNERLEFWIEEQGKFYPPEIRSQGRRWHLAFYIRVSARAREDVKNVILIDEPGLYLHATAQRDILKHLEDASQKSQILISTHSPYLIEAEKLDRIRLVQKHEARGTYVENKIHAVADKETLTPILTAIGLELNQGILGGDKVDNVIVEGPSDYFYLTAFNLMFNAFNGRFVSGGSSGNMPKIGTILQGWGCRVIYLYDNDKAYKDAKQSIKKDWLTINKECLTSLDLDGAIEDIFTKEEFASILEVEPGAILEKNSDHMKTTRRDKVLPSRLYLQKIRSNQAPPLSEETSSRITKLLNHLSEKFEVYKD
jgi:predicted ATP-dependent endonuclease of OLD family